MRNLKEHHTLFGQPMPMFGKDHGNTAIRTIGGISGFVTKSGHLIQRAWGVAGSALCGATVNLQDDPIPVISDYNGPRAAMGACCINRYHRLARRASCSK